MATVLLLHRDRMIAELLGFVLRARRFHILSASNIADGSAIVRGASVDLVVAELSKDFNTLDVLTTAEGLTRPAVIIGDGSDRAQVLAAVEMGVHGFVLRGQFDLAHFLRHVDRAIQVGPRLPKAAANSDATPTASTKPVAPNSPASAKAPPGAVSSVAASSMTPGEVLKQLKPVAPSKDVEAKVLECAELKALSPSVARVMDVASRPAASIDSLVSAIRCDHAIALKIIKLANSAVFSRGEAINSVKAAVLRVGVESIRQAVGTIGVMEKFSSGPGSLIDTLQFWEHSLAVGVASAHIAARAKSMEPESAFTAGLLHDVGRLLLAEAMPEHYKAILDTAHTHGLPLDQVERRVLNVSHADLMRPILRRWNFAKELVEPIVLHESGANVLRNATATQLTQSATVSLGNRLAQALLLGCSGNRCVSSIADLCELLRLAPKDIDTICAQVIDETEELRCSLFAHANIDTWEPLTQTLRNRVHGNFRPLCIRGEDGPDVYQILCARVGEVDGPRNIGIVHLRSANDATAAALRLKKAEAELGTGPLPLIIISPSAQHGLPPAAEGGRSACVRLPEPLPLDRFVETVATILARTQATQEPPASAAA
jgi:HD-like signal output (HDOD) protein/DNA-binding NarL/FixJ family response regulator